MSNEGVDFTLFGEVLAAIFKCLPVFGGHGAYAPLCSGLVSDRGDRVRLGVSRATYHSSDLGAHVSTASIGPFPPETPIGTIHANAVVSFQLPPTIGSCSVDESREEGQGERSHGDGGGRDEEWASTGFPGHKAGKDEGRCKSIARRVAVSEDCDFPRQGR